MVITKSLDHSIPRSPNHSITKSLDHQITRSPNHPITKSLDHQITSTLSFFVFFVMRIPILIILLCTCFIANIKAQCSVLVVMEQVNLDGCSVMPRIITTAGPHLFPCSAPDGFNQLKVGDYVYIDYIESGCNNFCLYGNRVDITCFSLTVGIENQDKNDEIKIYPTLVQSKIYLEGNDIVQIELYNDRGIQMLKMNNLDGLSLDVADLDAGIYFVRIITKNQIQVNKIVKL